MGRKDASATALPVDQYRKQIGESSFILVDHLADETLDCQSIWCFDTDQKQTDRKAHITLSGFTTSNTFVKLFWGFYPLIMHFLCEVIYGLIQEMNQCIT